MKAIHHIIHSLVVFAGTLSAVCLLGIGCTSTLEDALPPDTDGHPHIVLHLSVPEQAAMQTRAMSASVEAGINGLPSVLVFEQGTSGAEDTYAYTAEVKAGAVGSNSYIVTLSPSEKKYKLLVIANLTESLPTLTQGSTINAVKELITISSIGAWPTDKQIPMWGETDYQPIGDATVFKDANNATTPSDAIRMIRALARVDIGLNYTADYSSASGISGYQLTKVWVYNSKTKGYATGSGSILNWPTGISSHVPTDANHQLIDYTTGNVNLYAAEVYLSEAAAGNSWEDEDATGLVIGLTNLSTSQLEYHRVDFRDYTNQVMLSVLRNHHYRINIKEVKDTGFDTPEKAWKGKRISLGLEVKAWELVSQKATLPGVKYLTVDKKEVFIEGDPSVDLPAFNIETNILDTNGIQNWKVTSDQTWLTPTRDATDGKKLLLTAVQNTTDARTATLSIQSPDNRLTLRVAVKQKPKVVDPTVANGANCYILPVGSNFSFAAYTGGQGSTTALEDIEAVSIWRHKHPNGDGASDQYSTNGAPVLDKYTGKVSFKLATTFEGNLLIGIRNKTTKKMIWSWHIWIVQAYHLVEINKSGTFMDRNLGAHSVGKSYAAETYGCFYQWGRKDPFPGSYAETNKRQSTYYWNESSTRVTGNFPKKTFTLAAESTLAYATEHPEEFIEIQGNNNWLGVDDRNLWGGDTSTRTQKTIYDPCPAGWRVPSNKEDGWPANVVFSFNDEYDVKIDAYGGYYPKAFRLDKSGKLEGTFQYQNGYYWTSTPNNDSQGFYLDLQKKSVTSSHRGYGHSIRCVRDS